MSHNWTLTDSISHQHQHDNDSIPHYCMCMQGAWAGLAVALSGGMLFTVGSMSHDRTTAGQESKAPLTLAAAGIAAALSRVFYNRAVVGVFGKHLLQLCNTVCSCAVSAAVQCCLQLINTVCSSAVLSAAVQCCLQLCSTVCSSAVLSAAVQCCLQLCSDVCSSAALSTAVECCLQLINVDRHFGTCWTTCLCSARWQSFIFLAAPCYIAF